MNRMDYLKLLKDDNVKFVYNITEENIINELINLKQLTLELTDACNLNCKYCGYGEMYATHDKRNNKFMTFGTAKTIIDYLYNLWSNKRPASKCRVITIGFYGGEPLLNFDLIREIVNYIESLPPIFDIVFKYNMTTNGILLERYMNYLVEHKFTLLISLDGNEYAHSYRVDFNNMNSHDKIISNVRKLKKDFPDYFKNYVSFNSVLHDRNDVRGIKEYINNEFGKKAQISELNNFGICENKKNEFIRMYHTAESDISIEDVDFDEMCPDIMNLFRFVGKMSSNYYPTYNSLMNKQPRRMYPTGTCTPFGKKMFVTVNGKILPCEKIDHKYALGYIDEKGISLNLSQIAHKYTSYYSKMKLLCSKCYKKTFCSQCIFYMNNLDGKVNCPSYLGVDNVQSYIAYYIKMLHKHPLLYRKVSTDLLLQL